jgi:rubrerythrin
MGNWTLADIPWDAFDRSKVDPELVKIVKAACMVEHHGADYGAYLRSVFHDDPEFCATATEWADEEIQHGAVLRRYAELADPEFDFEETFRRFVEGHPIQVNASESVRGSRCGELVARCIVEVGTSTYYSALKDAAEEPVLREICKRVAGDEFRHYKLFYSTMKRYQTVEPLGLFGRLRVAAGRVFETGDDELSYAFYCGSGATGPYQRRKFSRAYAGRSLPLYRFVHVQRGLGMTLKAVGIKPQSRLGRLLIRLGWWGFRAYARSSERGMAYA